MNISDIYEIYLKCSTVCTDSRNLTDNCLFVCLKGANFDGNAFAESALENGASYVITENKELQGNNRCIVVKDCLETLQQLAHFHRTKLQIPVIGITGTNGKTTTKELINAVLSEKYKTAFTKGNLNNHIGVPLTLLAIDKTAEIAIVEMGANHVGEIAALCEIAEPTFGAITNIGVAHIEGFGSVENIIKTKKALYESVISRNGTLFVNEMDDILCENLNYDKVIFYGKDAENCIESMDPYLTINLDGYTVKTNLTGSYNIWNFLCAAAIGKYFGVPADKIAHALSNYQPSNHRSQVNTIGTNIVISDYYNANLTSMNAALNNMARLQHSHKVVILGQMGELGALSVQAHGEIADLTNKIGVEAYFIGEEFAKVTDKNVFSDVDEANDYFKIHPIKDAMILIKGSNSNHLYRLSSILEA